MVRTLPLDSETRPELSRILAIAAVILVHVLAFLLLLVPLADSQLQIAAPKQERWTLPVEIPTPPTPPVVVPVVPHQPVVTPTDSHPVTHDPQTSNPAIVDQGTQPATAQPAITSDFTGNIGPVDTSPVQLGSQLETVTATAPRYPRDEARAGVQGRVLLRILVGIDGRPLEVTIDQSSGNRTLDKTAREHVLKTWVFKPAMRNGQAVQAYGLVPIDFTMQ
ncbi:MAG: energy transducer TonB [Pseudoxanthomonas sp.]